MAESLPHLVEGGSVNSNPQTAARELQAQAPAADSALYATMPSDNANRYAKTPTDNAIFATPPPSADGRRENSCGLTVTGEDDFRQSIDFHSVCPTQAGQDLLNHLNNVLASIPSNAPPTPISPHDLSDIVQQQQQQQQIEKDDAFNQTRAEYFRFDPSLMPFVEKSYEVLSGGRRLSFDETPDTSALAEQLMRHREHRDQQQHLQQAASCGNLSMETSKADSSLYPQSVEYPSSCQNDAEESFLVDGLNRFAMRHQLNAASFDASLFHPDDAPHLGSDALQQHHQNSISNISLTDLSGLEGGGGGGGGGDGFITATGTDSVPEMDLKQPPFFSTPYSKSESKLTTSVPEPCFSLAAIFESDAIDSSSSSSSSSHHQFRPTAEEFQPAVPQAAKSGVPNSGGSVGGGAAMLRARTGVDRPDTPAPFAADKAFHLPVASGAGGRRPSLVTSTSGYGSLSPVSEISTSNVSSSGNLFETRGNSIVDGHRNVEDSADGNDYEDRPKTARERAAFLLQQEREMIQNMSANTLDQMRQAYAAVPSTTTSKKDAAGSSGYFGGGDEGGDSGGRSYGGAQSGGNLFKIEEHAMESSGESFSSSGVHSDTSAGDLSHLAEFVGRLQQRRPSVGLEKNEDLARSSLAETAQQQPQRQQHFHRQQHQQQHSNDGENAFQRLLKHIPLSDSSLPPPPVFHPHSAPSGHSQVPPPSVSQLTTMLRQRIMPPSPLTLPGGPAAAAASNSGFVDGFAAAASALAPYGGGRVGATHNHALPHQSNISFSPNSLVQRKSLAQHHQGNHAFFGNYSHGSHHHHHHGNGGRGFPHYTPSPLHAPPSPFLYPPPGSPFNTGSNGGHVATTGRGSSSELVPYSGGGFHGGGGVGGGFHGGGGVVGGQASGGALEWPGSPNELFGTSPDDPFSIERAARLYRNAATICEATCTWSGVLPPRIYRNPIYSCKVFIGGVPWDITEIGLLSTFKCYGNLRIEWPGKDGKHPKYPQPKGGPKGYVYILFDCDKSVKELLKQCTHDYSNGGEYYYKMSSRRMRCKEVQVIPWVLTDSNFIRCPSQRLDPQKTVFVGALHGMLNSEALATIFNDLFGGVVYAGVDTDKYKYPIGSGRVTFNNHKSFMRAVNAAFIEVKTAKFTKKIQVDPYLEDSPCCLCNTGAPGPYFCRELQCFKYFCRPCWVWQHGTEAFRHHKPLMRNSKSPSGLGVGNAFGGLAAGTLGQLMAGMTTFSSSKPEGDYEEYDGDVSAVGSVNALRSKSDRPNHAAYSSSQEDAYAAAASGYENAYVNALCAELTNMMQYNDAGRKEQGTAPININNSSASVSEIGQTCSTSAPPASGFRPTSVDDLFHAAATAAAAENRLKT